MKIFNKYISFLLVITLLSVTACSEDDATGFSTLVPTNPTISVTGGGNYSVNEIDKDEYTFDITLSEPQIVDVTVHVLATGEATLGEDYVLSASSVVIPAYRTSGKFTLSILSDEEFEETETLTLQIGDDRTANANLSPVNAVFTIANYVPPIPTKSDIVDFTLSWDFADFTYNGQDICDLIDDLDVTFQEPGDAGMYDSDLTGYALSSLACPEHGTLDINDMTEGTVYEVWVAIYSGFDAGSAGAQAIDVTLDFERANSDFVGSVTISDTFTSDMGAAGGVMLTLELNADVLTLKDADGATVGSGRVSSRELVSVSKPN